MMTIITSLGGNTLYEMTPEFSYPKILNEIDKKTLFEYSQEIVASLSDCSKRIFLLPEGRDKQFQLSPMISVVSQGEGKILYLQGDTGGAACSCLLAVDDIDAEDELIIISADQYIDANIQTIIKYFRQQQADAGVLTFRSLHPKWAFIRKQEDGQIIEVAEKKAISRDAIAGFYYFRKGKFFTRAAQDSILKGSLVNGQYYLSGCLNEMILQNMKIIGWPLAEGSYHNFYDIHAIQEFSSFCSSRSSRPAARKAYVAMLATKALKNPEQLFGSEVRLQEHDGQLSGITAVSQALQHFLRSAQHLLVDEQLSSDDNTKHLIFYTLYCQDRIQKLLDIIITGREGKIVEIQRSEVI